MDIYRYLNHENYRATAYKLLSACYHLPDESLLDRLAELEAALNNAYPEAAPSIAAMREITDLESMRVDFSGLFVGPFKLLAPPYGSIYLEGKREVMGTSTLDAQHQYIAAGLEITRAFKDAPDHIALELEFMYYLIFKEIEALGQADIESAINYLEKQKSFLDRHLGIWVAPFAVDVERHAKTGFYRHLATATRIFVQQDRTTSSEILSTQPWKTAQLQMT